MSKCNQATCEQAPVYWFTWPGQRGAHICEEHARKAQAVAEALGCFVEFIPLEQAVDAEPSA